MSTRTKLSSSLARADDAPDVVEAEVVAQVQAHLGQLDRYVGLHAQTQPAHPAPIRYSSAAATASACVRHVLAQVVQRCEHPLPVQLAHGFDGFVQRLAGYEAPRHLSRYRHADDQVLEGLVAGECNQGGSHDGHGHLLGLAALVRVRPWHQSPVSGSRCSYLQHQREDQRPPAGAIVTVLAQHVLDLVAS